MVTLQELPSRAAHDVETPTVRLDDIETTSGSPETETVIMRSCTSIPTGSPNDSVTSTNEYQKYDIPNTKKEVGPNEDEEGLCVICLEIIEPSKRISGSCDHVFHFDCLKEWMMTKNHNDCPTCRQPLGGDLDTILGIVREQTVVRDTTRRMIILPDPREIYPQTHEPDRVWERVNRIILVSIAIALVVLLVYLLVSKK